MTDCVCSVGFGGVNCLTQLPPTIHKLDGPGVLASPTTGGALITIVGEGFGPAGTEFQMVYGPYSALDCRVLDDLAPTCLTAPGVGKGHVASVDVDGLASLPSNDHTVSYSSPTIWRFSGAVPHAARGGDVITIEGSNFGAVLANVGPLTIADETGAPPYTVDVDVRQTHSVRASRAPPTVLLYVSRRTPRRHARSRITRA